MEDGPNYGTGANGDSPIVSVKVGQRDTATPARHPLTIS